MVRNPWRPTTRSALERQLKPPGLNPSGGPFQQAAYLLRHRSLYGDGPYGHDPLGVDQNLAALATPVLGRPPTN